MEISCQNLEVCKDEEMQLLLFLEIVLDHSTEKYLHRLTLSYRMGPVGPTLFNML